jgi:hypothetical protein
MVFATGGSTERMRLDSSGNLGLGVTPSAWGSEFAAMQYGFSGAVASYKAGTTAEFMHVISNAYNDNSSWRYIRDGAATRYEQNESVHRWFQAASGTAGNAISFSQVMTLDSSGNLGIGTTSPTAKLTVSGGAVMSRFQTGSATDGRIEFAYNTTDIGYIYMASASLLDITARSGVSLALGAGGSERMRITNAGDVGIGSTAPGEALEISRTADPKIRFLDVGNIDAKIGIVGSTALGFEVNGSERARIDSSGNMLIGTTSAAARLTVQGTDSTSSNWGAWVRNSAGTDLFRVRNDGYFITGSATQSPYNLTTGSAANVNMDGNGGLQRVTSSLKYKRDVQDAVHGLADVLALRPVTYKGKGANDGDMVFGGLIAEEVHAAGLTEFVVYAEDGSPDALAYSNMVSLAFKAIQELKAEFDAYKASHP